MSTIAYRDGFIAADTLASTGDKLMYGVKKIGRTEKYLFGFAGRFSGLHRIYDWVKEIEHEVSPQEFYKKIDMLDTTGLDASVLLISRDHVIWSLHEDGAIVRLASEYESVGSGQSYALGAMHAGASAEQAVEAACQFEPYTGGQVQVVSFASEVHSPTD